MSVRDTVQGYACCALRYDKLDYIGSVVFPYFQACHLHARIFNARYDFLGSGGLHFPRLSYHNELGDLSKLTALEISAFTNFSSGFPVALSMVMVTGTRVI